MSFDLPECWSDVAGWDRYHRESIRDGSSQKSSLGVDEESLIEQASRLLQNGIRRVWVPGCGTSLLPSLLMHLGFDVFATDVSSVALDYQRTCEAHFCRRWPSLNAPPSRGSLFCEVQDVREACRRGEFDWILNVKTMQGFTLEEMQLVAQSHFEALKCGEALFSTLNCQGEERDALEQVMVDAGFVVPYFELQRDFRSALRDTQLPFAFVLGRPVLLRQDPTGRFSREQLADEEFRIEARESLWKVARQFESLRVLAAPAEQAKLDAPGARFASIVYNTG